MLGVCRKDAEGDLKYLYALSPVFVVRPPTRVVPVDWALKPAGLEAGDEFRLIFLSSATRDAASTDIGVYNRFVQDLAAAGHSDIQAYASQFRAVACTAAVDAVDNTGTTGHRRPDLLAGRRQGGRRLRRLLRRVVGRGGDGPEPGGRVGHGSLPLS